MKSVIPPAFTCILKYVMKSTTTTSSVSPVNNNNNCELCHDKQRRPARIYCCSESAFLCSDCDSQVHTANFLVARHIRLPLCSLCKSYHSHFNSSCCGDINDASSSSSSSSTSVNNKTSSSTNCIDWKTRNVLVNWCARLGVSSSVIEVARHAFGVMNRSEEWSYRVGLAASLWFGLLRLLFTMDDNKTRMLRMRTLLKKLEEISGVPAKSIVVAHSRLAPLMSSQRRRLRAPVSVDEESSDEC